MARRTNRRHSRAIYRYQIIGRGKGGKRTTFRNAGSFGLRRLAVKKARKIRTARKKAGFPYKSIRVRKFDVLK